MNESFDFDRFRELAAALPPPLPGLVVSPATAVWLQRAAVPAPSGYVGRVGESIDVHVKDQVADAWVISDRDTLRRYLAGELSEVDLRVIAAANAIQASK